MSVMEGPLPKGIVPGEPAPDPEPDPAPTPAPEKDPVYGWVMVWVCFILGALALAF